jgi:uncharacterized protein
MKKVDRRSVVGALVTAGAAAAAADVAKALPPELKLRDLQLKTQFGCLYHCDFGDHARFSQQLRNINNHFAAYNYDPRALKLIIVAHSAGIKFFLKDLADTPWAQETIDPELVERTKSLSQHGLEVYLCKVTFATLKIDLAKARADNFIKFVPSGIATASALQAKGYSYLKVG